MFTKITPAQYHGPGEVIALVETGVVRGSIAVSAGKLHGIYVPPAQRRSRIGTQLLEHAVINYSVKSAIRTVVRVTDHNSLAFFVRNKWVPVGLHRGVIDDTLIEYSHQDTKGVILQYVRPIEDEYSGDPEEYEYTRQLKEIVNNAVVIETLPVLI